MPSRIMRLLWFLSSYTPLWVVMTIKHWPVITNQSKEGSTAITIVLLLVIIVSNCLVGHFLLNQRERRAFSTAETERIEKKSDLSREYIVTYAISLIGFDLSSARDGISFCVLLAFFAYLYVKYDQIVYNPMLEVFGFNMYSVDLRLTSFDVNVNASGVMRSGILLSRKSKQALQEDPFPVALVGEGGTFIEVKKRR